MNPIVSGINVFVEGGMNCSYIDNNQNMKIDGLDTIHLSNVESGDLIEFRYIPTGGIIARYSFD
jgi:hypothetical protein